MDIIVIIGLLLLILLAMFWWGLLTYRQYKEIKEALEKLLDTLGGGRG